MYKTMVLLGLMLYASSGYSENWDSYVCQAQPVETKLEVMGVWAPLHWMPIKAPAKGILQKKFKSFGEFVQKDEILFELASPQLAIDVEVAQLACQEKEANYIEACEWSESIESAQALHELELANLSLKLKQEQLENTKILVEMGGLAKENLIQENLNLLRAQQQQMSAKQRYQQSLLKGSETAKRKALLSLRKAQLEYQGLLQALDGLTIKAPMDGHLFPPDAFYKKELTQVMVYDEVEQSQCLAVMANAQDFGVVFELDPTKMDKLEMSDEIIVEAGGEHLHAVVDSAQPLQARADSSQGTSYQIKLRLQRECAKPLRLGHRLPVQMVRYQESTLPAVPVSSIHWQGAKAYVYKQSNEKWDLTQIQIESVSYPLAHVAKGLQIGDVIGIKS